MSTFGCNFLNIMRTNQLNAHVKTAIELAGGLSEVARCFKIKPWAVSKWRTKVPSERVLPLCKLINWQVTPHQIDPILYPHPDDGLPDELRRYVSEQPGARV